MTLTIDTGGDVTTRSGIYFGDLLLEAIRAHAAHMPGNIERDLCKVISSLHHSGSISDSALATAAENYLYMESTS